ncbi:MAG: Bro-N domain-containing protein [Bacteroides sp.]|nr:Bro-N domain-containing protein [Bacteroides sp.]
MMKKHSIQIFNDRKVRAVWDEAREEWYFSVVDVVAVLTDSVDPTSYWRKLKQRLKKEGNETVTNCHGLKLKAADGKYRMTDVVDYKQLFRLIQSIPSPKAEPFKLWIASVAKQRLDQMQDPELSIEQAILDYRNLGYSENWINQRIRSIEVRKALTDEWRKGGIKEGVQFASLTDIITSQWSGKSTKEYKRHKGLKKENLRDNMTNIELALNTLAEASATELSKQKTPKGYEANAEIAKQGGDVAKAARIKLESQLGKTVISSAKASDYLLPPNSVEDIKHIDIYDKGEPGN